MKKGFIFRIVLFLFCFLPCPSLAQGIMQSEYWFDGDVEKKVVNKMNGNETYEIVSKIPTAQLDDGLHQFNFRVMQSDGMYSPVLTRSFFKMSGKMNLLEYWFDGDNSNVRYIYGKITDGNTVFQEQIDLSDVSEGVHRLYYRGISVDGVSSTAISSTPIMVKPRNNFDPNQQKVVSYSVAVDDEEPMNYTILDPQNDITQKVTYDARHLKEGYHSVYFHFWNSAGAGVAMRKTFKVAKETTPLIDISATEKDGIVELKMNSVPNDISYIIERTDANGAIQTITPQSKAYPTEISYTDKPGNGSFTYIGKAKYKDFAGMEHEISSKEVQVVIEKASNDKTGFGYIIGELQHDGTGRIVTFSDGVSVKVDDRNNLFMREMIPVGTQLTMNVSNDTQYTYEEQTVTINIGVNKVSMAGTVIEGAQPEVSAYDIAFDSKVSWEPQKYFKFKVANILSRPWTGVVRITAISKSQVEQYEQDVEDALTLAGSNASLVESNSHVLMSEQFTLQAQGPDRIKELFMMWGDFLQPSRTEDYSFYFESIEYHDGVFPLKPVVKKLALHDLYSAFDDLSGVSNPITLKIEKCNSSALDAEMLADMLIALCTKVKALDSKVGKVADVTKVGVFSISGGMLGDGLSKLNYDELKERIGKAVKSEGGISGDEALSRLYSDYDIDMVVANSMLKQFRSNVAWKAAKDVGKYWKKAEEVMDYINTYEDWDDMDNYNRFFKGSKALLKLAEVVGKDNPYYIILKTYLDIAEVTVKKGLEIAAEIDDYYLATKLLNNRPLSETDGKRFNSTIDFKIKIQQRNLGFWWKDIDFSKQSWLLSEIDSVLVKANNGLTYNATTYYNMVGVEDGICLKLKPNPAIGMYIDNSQNHQDNLWEGKPLDKFWMEIYWENGRTTMIPLIKGNGIERIIDGGQSQDAHERFVVTLHSESGLVHLGDIIHLADN